MQEPNTENSEPTQPMRVSEETVPTRVAATEVTQPSKSNETIPPMPPSTPPAAGKKARPRRWMWVVLGILMIFLFAGAGSWIGYRSAIQLRQEKQENQRVTVATEHFMLGLQAQTNKQYQLARKQFEYVIQLDPSFPGAADKLREVMITMSMAQTPTAAPTLVTPTLTPTVDTRPQDQIYNSARQQFEAQQWDALFATIDSLRRIDPKYHAVEIDDMLYFALRYEGIDKIIHQANLEGGLYDLALAERFGPLDVDALGYRNWARLYLNGASFWEVDWQKVMNSFEQIYPYFPNMRDSSGLTAVERYRIAARSYADKLLASGDSCGAFDYYKKSLDAVADGQLALTATAVYAKCHPPTETVTPTLPVTPTPTATGVAPTAPVETPTLKPTATETPTPGPATPTHTPTK